MKSFLAIVIGGSVGCIIRWQPGVRLNNLFPFLPPGTLIVNLAGGFIIGSALAWFLRHPYLDPTWRLLVMTGLCGGMTTFSTFSLEEKAVMQLIDAGTSISSIAKEFHTTRQTILRVRAAYSTHDDASGVD